MEFVWSADSNDYAIREGGARIKIHKNFAEKAALKVEYAVEGIHGGALVGEYKLQHLLQCWIVGCSCCSRQPKSVYTGFSYANRCVLL